MLKLLQFTDLHLHNNPQAEWRGLKPQQTFEKTLYHAQTNHWPPDAVLLTGDLGNDEFDESYSRLANTAAQWSVPMLAIPGNHDNPAALAAAFTAANVTRHTLLDFPHWRIVGLDSHWNNEVRGRLSEDEWQRLDKAANSRGERHLLVTLHHPPLDVGSAWLDPLKLEQADEFRAKLAKLGAAVCLFGHIHQAWDSTDGGVRYLGTPSTSRQFRPGDRFMEDELPPAYRWLELHDNGRVESDIVWVNS